MPAFAHTSPLEQLRCEMCDLAATLTGDPDTAEDLVQDVFLRFLSTDAPVELGRSAYGYFAMAVRRAHLNHRRSAAARRGAHRGWAAEADVHRSRAGPRRERQSRHAAEQLRRATETLPPTQADVFDALYVRGMTRAGAATELEMTPAAVKKSAHRARASLRRWLQQGGASSLADLRQATA